MAFYDWTCARVSQLLDMRINGFSAAEIAKALGTTRNSAIGKAYRLGVALPGSQSENGTMGGKARARRARYNYRFEKTPPALKRPGTFPLEPPSPFRMPSARAIGHHAIDGLRRHDCRWPIGDPGMPEFRFCGAETAPHQSYCFHHYEASIRRVGERDDKD